MHKSRKEKLYMMNVAIFTKQRYIANKRPFITWYDGTPICNGRGQRLDGAFIDMNLSKEIVKEIIIPGCYFAEHIFTFDNQQDKFVKSNIDNVLNIS